MRREEKKGGHRPPATGDRARRPQGDDYKTPRKSRPQTGCYRRSCTSPAGRRLQNAKEKPATGRLLQKIVVAASLREAKKRKAAIGRLLQEMVHVAHRATATVLSFFGGPDRPEIVGEITFRVEIGVRHGEVALLSPIGVP